MNRRELVPYRGNKVTLSKLVRVLTAVDVLRQLGRKQPHGATAGGGKRPPNGETETRRILANARPSYWTSAGLQPCKLERISKNRRGRVVAYFRCEYFDASTGRIACDRYIYGVQDREAVELKSFRRVWL